MSLNSGERKGDLLWSAVMFLALGLALLVYWPGLSGPFLLDDMGSINSLKSDRWSWVELSYDVTHNTSGLLGRPVSVLSLAISRIMHGPDTWGFKYHNLLLHLINGLLLLWLLLKVVPRLAPELDRRRASMIALAVSLLWLLHPLMVSTVLYAVQRMAELSALFTLAALLAYVFMREAIGERSWRFWLPFALFPVLASLAVLSKENGALVVIYVVLIEWLVYRSPVGNPPARRRLLAFHGLFTVVPIVLGGIYLLTHTGQFLNYSFRNYDLVERLMTQLHVVFFYGKLILVPAISDMSLFHDGWQPVRSLDLATALLALFWVAMVVAVFLLRRKAPVVAFGIGWFLVSHLMESTVLSLELVFEHRNYLAAAGLLFIPVFYLFASWSSPRIGMSVAGMFFLLFAFMTHARVGEWESEDMIYSIAVREHPESIRARIPYSGIVYGRGDIEEALKQVRIADELNPDDYSPLVIQMLYLCGRGREEEISELFDDAIRRAAIYPATPASISAMDLILDQVQRGNCKELASVRMLDWLQAAREQEDNKKNRMFTGYIQRQQGFFHYVLRSNVKGYEYMINAYESTGMASILGEIITIELQLGSLDTAELLLEKLAAVNEERLGTEQMLLDRYTERFEQAKKMKAAQESEAKETAATAETAE